MGELNEARQKIIQNRLSTYLSKYYQMVSADEHAKAEEKYFESSDACSSEQCIRFIQEELQIERIFQLQMILEEGLTQLTLVLTTNEDKFTEDDICEECKIRKLYEKVGSLVQKMITRDLGNSVASTPQVAVVETTTTTTFPVATTTLPPSTTSSNKLVSEEEQEAWNYVKEAKSVEELQFFIENFPQSRFSAFAYLSISRLSTPDSLPNSIDGITIDQKSEEELWALIANSTVSEELQYFTRLFPNSPLAHLKQRRLAIAQEQPTLPQLPDQIATTRGASQEKQVWELIETTKDLVELQFFLKIYPQSRYKFKAGIAIKRLEATEEQRWKDRLAAMKAAFEELSDSESSKSAPANQTSWQEWLAKYQENNPYSSEENQMKETAKARLSYWQEQTTVEDQWDEKLQEMTASFNQIKKLEASTKVEDNVKTWEKWQEQYKEDNPYSQKDEELLQSAKDRLAQWQTLVTMELAFFKMKKRQEDESIDDSEKGKAWENFINTHKSNNLITDKDNVMISYAKIQIPSLIQFPTDFVLIKAGSFQMGSNKGQELEKPIHQVTISLDFYLLDHEVTVKEYRQFDPDAKSHNCSSADCPVENVSWHDAQAYIKWLNKKEEKDVYRLPTEAEWEYAARAGTTSPYSFDDGFFSSDKLENFAWFFKNSNNKTHTVKTKKPNPWGLYDMHGNVLEWVQDWYGDYSHGSVTDPTGPSSGSVRVDRGGGWRDDASSLRSAYRYYYSPGPRYYILGFRLLRIR